MHSLSPFLRYFEEVARLGSIRRAAENLHIAPSAVTRQIRNFEDELGVPLFERLPRGVRLTSAGETMLFSVRRLQREFDASLSQVEALKGLRKGKVRIGALQYLSEHFIPALLKDINERYPGISFVIHGGNSDSIAEQIMNGDLDIGLCWTPSPLVPLRRVRTATIPVGLVVLPNHALAVRRSVSLRECFTHRLILPAIDMELRRMLDATQTGLHGVVEPFLETNSIAAMRQSVKVGLGVALMTRVSVLEDIKAGTLVHVPLSDRGMRSMQFSILVRDGQNLSIAGSLIMESIEKEFDHYVGATESRV